MLTASSSSIARSRAARPRATPCTCSVSSIWLPMVKTGFSAVIGSWNTSAIPAPRIFCISRSPSVIRSRSLNTMRPPAIRPGRCTRRRIDSAVTDLPLPDSPTRQSVSPSLTWKLTSMTAGAAPPGRSNTVFSRSTLSSGAEVRASRVEDRPAAGDFSAIDFLVLAEHLAHGVRDLSDGRSGFDRLQDRRNQVVAPARGGGDRVQRRAPARLIARRADLPHALDLPRLDQRIDLQGLDPAASAVRREISLREIDMAVDADDRGLAGIDPLLRAVRGILDLTLDVGRLDRRQRAAEPVDRLQQRARLALDAVGQLFDGK